MSEFTLTDPAMLLTPEEEPDSAEIASHTMVNRTKGNSRTLRG